MWTLLWLASAFNKQCDARNGKPPVFISMHFGMHDLRCRKDIPANGWRRIHKSVCKSIKAAYTLCDDYMHSLIILRASNLIPLIPWIGSLPYVRVSINAWGGFSEVNMEILGPINGFVLLQLLYAVYDIFFIHVGGISPQRFICFCTTYWWLHTWWVANLCLKRHTFSKCKLVCTRQTWLIDTDWLNDNIQSVCL